TVPNAPTPRSLRISNLPSLRSSELDRQSVVECWSWKLEPQEGQTISRVGRSISSIGPWQCGHSKCISSTPQNLGCSLAFIFPFQGRISNEKIRLIAVGLGPVAPSPLQRWQIVPGVLALGRGRPVGTDGPAAVPDQAPQASMHRRGGPCCHGQGDTRRKSWE